MTKQRSFMGIPVEGDVSRNHSRVEQRPLEEFQEIFKAVWDDPTVHDFGWRQYTPFFNDGEICTFGVHGFWLRTVEDMQQDGAAVDEDDGFDEYMYEVGNSHPSLGKVLSKWDDEVKGGSGVIGEYVGPDRARYDRCHKLDAAVQGGAFYNVLYDLFGDHAEVIARRDHIYVDEYSHD